MPESAKKLNQLSVIPLYKQLKKIIEDDIDQGLLQPGQLLPSEMELSHRHGVSRITVRTALQELTDEGRLIRRRGKGTFVT
ncbi:MAG: GntR family transcriptional regulator, partial [Christensenellaceae bacterium]|nr:GntR family transcriptional regulator [Christensenellaceae bacterium]